MKRGIRRCLLTVGAYLMLIDWFIVCAYERYIADPLQLRGVSLRTQVKGCFFVASLIALVCPWPHTVFQGFGNVLLSAVWAWNAIILSSTRTLDVQPSESLYFNHWRHEPIAILARLMILANVAASIYLHRFSMVPVLLGWLTLACEPKPPRPKRLKVLKPVTEWT